MSGWVHLKNLRNGAVFETRRDSIRAVKSEYFYESNGQSLCILLASGEFAHFPRGNAELVREIDIDTELGAEIESYKKRVWQAEHDLERCRAEALRK